MQINGLETSVPCPSLLLCIATDERGVWGRKAISPSGAQCSRGGLFIQGIKDVLPKLLWWDVLLSRVAVG